MPLATHSDEKERKCQSSKCPINSGDGKAAVSAFKLGAKHTMNIFSENNIFSNLYQKTTKFIPLSSVSVSFHSFNHCSLILSLDLSNIHYPHSPEEG